MAAPATQTEESLTRAEDGDAPLLEVIIVCSTGGRDLLRDALSSLERHPLRQGPMTVWVVDNASTDGTAEAVRAEFPWVRLWALDWNSGFCIANNVALRASTAPYVVLLNPDTEVYEGSLDRMVDLMRAHPEIGMSGPRLVQRDGTLDHAAKRSFPTPLSALAHFVGLGRRAGAPSALAQYRAPELGEYESGEVDAVNGAFMLVNRPALEQVGLLDERYWLYMEDLDWCYRFKQAGWLVWYEGSVDVVHVKGGTTVRKRHRGLRHNSAFHRSMGRFYRKFYSGRNTAQDAAVYLAIGAKFTIAAVRSAVARRSLR